MSILSIMKNEQQYATILRAVYNYTKKKYDMQPYGSYRTIWNYMKMQPNTTLVHHMQEYEGPAELNRQKSQ